MKVSPNSVILEALCKDLSLTAEMNYLDLGCGMGEDMSFLNRRFGFRVHGVDKRDMARSLKGSFIHGDVEVNAAIINEKYDVIYAFNFLHLIADKHALIRNLMERLKSGGIFIIQTINLEYIAKRYINQFFDGLLELDLGRHPSCQQIYDIFIDAGYSNCVVRTYNPGKLKIDENYVKKLREGYCSSLNLLPQQVKAAGFEKLSKAIARKPVITERLKEIVIGYK